MCKETALLQTLVCGSARGVCKCAVLCVGSSFKCYPNPNCPSGQKWEGKNKFLQTDSVHLFMLIVCFSTLLLTGSYKNSSEFLYINYQFNTDYKYKKTTLIKHQSRYYFYTMLCVVLYSIIFILRFSKTKTSNKR